MPNKNGWPDCETPGFPLNPTKDGTHLIADKYGKAALGLLDFSPQIWSIGAESYHPADVAETWRYIRPAITPDGGPV
jgi:hypothetical protein